MTAFSLSINKEKVLPSEISSGGRVFPVNPDFRNILRILRMIGDDGILEAHKPFLLKKWFYTNGDGPLEGFEGFIAPKEKGRPMNRDSFPIQGRPDTPPKSGASARLTTSAGDEPSGDHDHAASRIRNESGFMSQHFAAEAAFDFELDSKEIYAGFLKDYGIDLLSVPFLHWYQFTALLGCLSSDSPFMRKIELRLMDISGLKGEALSRAKKAKQAVQLPLKNQKEIDGKMSAVEAALLGGGDVKQILNS